MPAAAYKMQAPAEATKTQGEEPGEKWKAGKGKLM
jgi:hypothetical protein